MTEMLTDQKWENEYPDGYSVYLSIYKQKIVHLELWYLKHIRRYGYTHLCLLDNNGNLIKSLAFELVDRKIKEGSVISNDQEFSTIYTAWNYFQNLVFKTLVNP